MTYVTMYIINIMSHDLDNGIMYTSYTVNNLARIRLHNIKLATSKQSSLKPNTVLISLPQRWNPTQRSN